MTTAWTGADLRNIDTSQLARVPVLNNLDGLQPIGGEGIYYWDMWPVQAADGMMAKMAGREMWMVLSAPDRGDPALRHFEAKIRWLERIDGRWHDRGPALPDFDTDYEREWAGTALLKDGRLTLHFTGAGTDARPGGYQQRLFETSAMVDADGTIGEWSVPQPSLDAITPDYMAADQHEGEAGKIKAFRDPAYFRDPADGAEYLAFTASLAGSQSAFNGAFGLAKRVDGAWQLVPPAIHADGVNNELERAHLVSHAGRYYAFWVTQRFTFAPDLRHAPNGLYGMVADRLDGPYRPLNGCGLVIANPEEAGSQCYSWFVSSDLVVSSFVDIWPGGDGVAEAEAASGPQPFGGVPAPLLRLTIDGDRCTLADEALA